MDNNQPFLSDDEYIQCSRCERKSYGGDQINSICNMPSPSGLPCDGIMRQTRRPERRPDFGVALRYDKANKGR
jgi:hypothetical protein